MAKPIVDWNEERVALLTQLWGEGHSARVIAEKMGLKSRNMVIGKAHRLKLPARPRRTGPSKAPKKTNPRRMVLRSIARQRVIREQGKPPVADLYISPPLPPDEPVSLDIELLDLKPCHCRYPHGDNPFLFCGHPAKAFGTPYCEFHHDVCNRPMIRRRAA